MRFSEASRGRVFVLRLEHGEVIHESLERFAEEHGVLAATVLCVGGAERRSALVVGPEDGEVMPPKPVTRELDGVCEIAAVGTLFPDEHGRPVLHMHAACGRGGATTTGCVRAGVKVWHVGEVVVQELVDTTAVRRHDRKTGFALLEP